MKILLPNNNVLTLPDDYKKIPLPGLTEWTAALRARKDRGEEYLFHNGKFCCLGVLSQLQGRITLDGRDMDPGVDPDDLCEVPDESTLSAGNPLFDILGHEGSLPYGATVDGPTGLSGCDLTGINDNLEQGAGWEIIPELLEHLYYDPNQSTHANQPAE